MMQQLTLPRPVRPRLLANCAMGLALAAFGHGGVASAQVSAIQGTGTVDAGIAFIDNVGGTATAPRTNVQVSTANAVINWTPTDTTAGATPIDFLPANGLAYFYSNSDPNFIVLNRVIPATTRQIGLNGQVLSNVDISGTTSPGGNVWFYSPTGFVAGTGSRFSTNGLILTANDIPYTPGVSGGINFGPTGEIQMTATAGSQANVTLLPGSLISNTSNDAYTLIVAPSIVQGGTIELDGSVGLIAAESVSVIIQNSLFNINVQVGTSVANAIIHTGSTGAGAAADPLAGPQHTIVMATPANTALTVLLGGNLGATAVNAAAADRSVILSGGYDYNDVSSSGLAITPDTTTPVDFRIGTTSFNADLTALTTGAIIGNPSRGAAINFLGNASLTAGTSVSLTADLDETITASANLILRAPLAATVKLGTTNTEAGAGNSAARINVLGDLVVSADVSSLDPAVDAVAGAALISLDAGAVGPLLSVTGNTLVTAAGIGAEGPSIGGNGFGGTAQIVLNGGTFTAGAVDIIADGIGAGGTPGGSGSGGQASFLATDAQGYTLGNLTIRANGVAGDGFDLTAPFGTGRGGIATFLNQGASAAAANSRAVGNLVVQANGNAGTVNGLPGLNSVAGLAQFSDLASGANGHARYASLVAQALGQTAPAGSGVVLASGGSATTIDDSLFVDSAGNITIAVTGNAPISAANSVSLFAPGDLIITHTGQGTPLFPTITGRDLFIEAVGNVNAGPGTLLSASGALSVVARTGNITADSLTAVDSLDVHALGNVSLKNASTAGPVTILSNGQPSGRIYITAGVDPVELVGTYLPVDVSISGLVNAAGQLDVHAGRDILGGGTGAALLEGQAVQLIGERDISGANLSIRSRSDLNWLIGRNLLADTVDVAGQINMVDLAGTVLQPGQLVVNGDLGIGNLILRGPSAGFVRATGNIAIGGAQTFGLDVASTGGSITLGTIQAGNALTIATPGTLTVTGQAAATIVRASSNDVAITGSGRIGAAGTTSLVELTNNDPTRRSYYGGAGTTTGYSLNGTEMGLLNGSAITLIAPQTAQSSASAPDVTIGDMTVTGAQLGAQGTLAIQTPGRVLINGAANFTGLASGNTFAIRAGQSIMLDNQTGSVDLRGTNNALGGRIDFSAPTIMAVSSAAQSALATLSDPAAIDALLGANDGRISSNGVLRAGAMQFAVTNGLFIQNTGTTTFLPLRRGFSVGTGGITVSTPVGRTTPTIVINGQAATTGGVSLFGIDTIPLVSINGQPAPSSSGSRAGSTINGCDFTNVGDCRTPLSPDIPLTRDRVKNVVEKTSDAPPGLAVDRQSLVTPGIELQDIGRLSYEPLIDEPVTGSGNDDLWVPACKAGTQGNCLPPADGGKEP